MIDKEAVLNSPEQATDPKALDCAAIERIIDANLDRGREGLRVMEDWARFGLDRSDLVVRIKNLRQRLGLLHQQRFKQARHAATDGSTGLAHPAQEQRRSPQEVVAANAARVQEALRVLEEFGRLIDAGLAAAAATIRYELYDIELDLLSACRDGDSRRELLRSCHLYLITSPVENLDEVVAAALAAGVRLVQYRAKAASGAGSAPETELDDHRRLRQASRLRLLCHRHGALFIVNDRIDIALAVQADGVHLGQGDLPTAVARRLMGPELLIGRSTHAIDQLRQAVREGCDYVGVGPVNATPTKPGREPVGIDYVSQAAGESPLPFFAIGGIDDSNLADVRAAGL
jgi:thiamine-phosphate pyrophosphorylase